ncbi:hypothetical protein SPRG_16473 [Saprolegnia parasitica CBS 223.65]|uniref:Sel1 domain-containing protein n=1 Tax=Saprolegnia parasitica (strain CBS 223.65) TaxID=695850 RepID=A0A067BI01_SAPPC|nr:hypothetical protein SPRG_16473 [Saprolegnia parasitica CBS 223.65]KDO17773.1 hypothetical protein SPRG_16473 [Saprolegnia parasitica CBS 223.65]|eukprot:XP_012211521.1 hypothetical protein SPRG_16473 [Saprolegnia parasitica CBS 223.65]
MVCLAQMYRDGRVVESDHEAATQWCTRAASLGSVEATFALGDLLVQKARLVSHVARRQETYALAMVRLTQAADQGHRDAQYAAGHLYEIGAVGAVQWQLAKDSYLKASDQGHSKAQEALGRLYYHGHGVEMDKTQAGHYFQLATQGHGVAAQRAAQLYYSGHKGADVRSEKRLAFEMYLIAARTSHDAESMNALGLMYEDGEGVAVDMTMAADCFRQAADRQSAHGHFNYACLLRAGRGVEKDVEAAKHHFEQALALGYAQARQFLSTTK